MTTATLPLFNLVEYKEASPEVKKIYDDTKKNLNLPFVLNWFKCQGKNATLLHGNWEKLKSTLILGQVPNILKQLIIYNISNKRGCQYCAQAHSIFANLMGKSLSDDAGFKVTENLDTDVIPLSYKAALKIVTKAALSPASIGEDDFEELNEAGFSNDEIQELMSQADLVNMLNTIADISGIRIDNELLEIEQ